MERLTDAISLGEQKSIISALVILTRTAQDLDPGEGDYQNIVEKKHLEKPIPGSD
jgi:hypothetical protein